MLSVPRNAAETPHRRKYKFLEFLVSSTIVSTLVCCILDLILAKRNGVFLSCCRLKRIHEQRIEGFLWVPETELEDEMFYADRRITLRMRT